MQIGVDPRIPVDVLTGFLGSGKTTVLRHLLTRVELPDVAVLINELGLMGLDQALITVRDAEPVLLRGGCICCSLREDVSKTARDLWSQRTRGEMPPFERLIVETTGVADPTPVLATMASDLVLRHHFRPGNVIATVDAVNGLATLNEYPVALRQVMAADRLLVTKTDLVDRTGLEAMQSSLQCFNPAAPIRGISRGVADVDFMFHQDNANDVARAAKWAVNIPVASEALAHGGITSFVIHEDMPLDWNAFGVWFSLLAHRHGNRILRMKGILAIEGSATPVVVHAAQHLVHAPEHLNAWPPNISGSTLVFIGKELDRDLVRRSFRAFVSSAGREEPS